MDRKTKEVKNINEELLYIHKVMLRASSYLDLRREEDYL